MHQTSNQNASAFGQDQTSPRSSEANSVKDYILKLKGQLGEAYGQLKEYKKLQESYRSEIEQMRHVLEAVN